jgi:thiol-disulfide isomerase/thioredoxin
MLKTTCIFCEKTNYFNGDPFYITINCDNCCHNYFHTWCEPCKKVIKYKGIRKNFDTNCHTELKYRYCSSCESYSYYDTNNNNNSVLYCNCGNLVDTEIYHQNMCFHPHIGHYLSEQRSIIRPLEQGNIKEISNNNKLFDIKCSLNDIYNGTIQYYKYADKNYEINIKKGYGEGTKITYDVPNFNFYEYKNLVFIIKYDFDNNIEIENKDIIYKIDKKIFINPNKKYKLTIPHPENDIIIIAEKNSLKDTIIKNKGLPSCKNYNNGNFIIRYI